MTTSESDLTALAEVVGVLEPDHYDGKDEWGVGVCIALAAYAMTIMALQGVNVP